MWICGQDDNGVLGEGTRREKAQSPRIYNGENWGLDPAQTPAVLGDTIQQRVLKFAEMTLDLWESFPIALKWGSNLLEIQLQGSCQGGVCRTDIWSVGLPGEELSRLESRKMGCCIHPSLRHRDQAPGVVSECDDID